MDSLDIIIWTIIAHLIGAFICCLIAGEAGADGWELANPYCAYKLIPSINWFGAVVVSVVFNLLCPIGSVCYWFYKLCTLGKKTRS